MARLQFNITLPSGCLFSLVAATIVWLGLDHGGYFSPAWGWTTIALAWTCAVAFVVRRGVVLDGLDVVFGGGLAAFGMWSAISLAWTLDVTNGVENVERILVYVSACFVAIALRDRYSTVALRAAVLAGMTAVCAYSLATRLFPNWLGFYSDVLAPGRLFNPLGYSNAQGTFAALGLILAAGVATSARNTIGRVVGAGILPLLALDCYFTLSRGAIVGLVAGLVAWIILDPRRLRSGCWLVALAPWPALAVGRAAQLHGLSGARFTLDSASAGHRLAGELALLTVAAVAWALVLITAERRITITWAVRSGLIAAWVIVAIVAGALSIARFGSPVTMVRSAHSALTARQSESGNGPSVDPDRVFSLSLSGRNYLWGVSWNSATSHPLIGTGAGSFEQRWLSQRPFTGNSRWAHSLYLEALGETGSLGFVILAMALAAPIVASARARSNPALPALLGAYVAYLVHAGVDWDWEVPALTLAALWSACGIMAAPERRQSRVVPVAAGWVLAGTAVAVAVIAGVTLAGNRDLTVSHNAAIRGNYTKAAQAATAAARWQPWSYLPHLALGQAKMAQGNTAAAAEAFRSATRDGASRWNTWYALATAASGSTELNALRSAHRLNPLSREVATYCRRSIGTGSPLLVAACRSICGGSSVEEHSHDNCRAALASYDRRLARSTSS